MHQDVDCGQCGQAQTDGNTPLVDLEQIAELAQLWISPAEKAALEKDMAEMLCFADALQAIDTKGVPATTHMALLQNVLRQDVAAAPDFNAALLENAPASLDGFILLPGAVK